jgi:hypothetical protein
LTKFLPAFLVFIIASSAYADTGRVIAIGDEWLLSDMAFTATPGQTNQLAENIAGYFSDNQPADFLVISSIDLAPPRGVNGPALSAKMLSLGHTWTINPVAPITLANLSQYDGVFFSGTVGSGAANSTVIGDYIRDGGRVLVMAGTGAFGDAPAEAAGWNPLLNQFGLGFGDTWFAEPPNPPNLLDVPVVPDVHPLSTSLTTITWGSGQNALDLDAGDPVNAVALRGNFAAFGNGPQGAINDVIAVYNVPVPEPGTAFLAIACIALSCCWRRRLTR